MGGEWTREPADERWQGGGRINGRRWVALAGLLLAGALPGRAVAAQEMLWPGDARIAPDRIQAHWATYRFIQFARGDSTVVGRLSRRVERVHHTAEEPSILISMQFHGDRRSGLDIVYLDAETLAMRVRYLTAPTGLKIYYQSGQSLQTTYVSRAAERLVADTSAIRERFGGGADLVLAALDLDPGEEVSLPDIGGAATTLSAALVSDCVVLVGPEPLDVPGVWSGEVSRFESVQASGTRVTYWISKEAPHLIRQEFRSADGVLFLRWELERLTPEPLAHQLR
ncbi:MAG: hypothetical protein R3E10_06600 [Gemmatimonadota bacterium]